MYDKIELATYESMRAKRLERFNNQSPKNTKIRKVWPVGDTI